MKKHVHRMNKRLAEKAAKERARAEAEAQAAEDSDEEEDDEGEDEEEDDGEQNDGENEQEEEDGEEDDGEEDEDDEEVAATSKIDDQFIARMLGKQTAEDADQAEDDIADEDEDEEDDEEQGDDDKEPDMRHVGVGEDQFFDLDEMERYIGEEEDKYMRREAKKAQKLMAKGHDGVNDDDDDLDDDEDEEEEDDLDLFAEADDDEEDDGADLRYEDFWGTETSSKHASKKQKKEKQEKKAWKQAESDEEDEEDDDEEGQNNELFDDAEEEGEDSYDEDIDSADEGSRKAKAANSEQLSTYEKAQLRIKEKIAQIEAELIGEKPWQMQGEVEGRMRPENSLLSAMIVDMERASKPTPVITVEKTATLEDMIKKRILDQNFDDVIPREIANAALKPGAAVGTWSFQSCATPQAVSLINNSFSFCFASIRAAGGVEGKEQGRVGRDLRKGVHEADDGRPGERSFGWQEGGNFEGIPEAVPETGRVDALPLRAQAGRG
jgi:U3 small nucleolar RNA-associated protein MPP10